MYCLKNKVRVMERDWDHYFLFSVIDKSIVGRAMKNGKDGVDYTQKEIKRTNENLTQLRLGTEIYLNFRK